MASGDVASSVPSNASPYRADDILLLYRIRRATGWMAFFTMVIAIGTAAAAYFFWQQLSLTRDQLDEMQELHEQVQKTINALEKQVSNSDQSTRDLSQLIGRLIETENKQVVAFQDMAKLAVNARLTLERPWLGVESVTVPVLISNQAFSLKALIRNSGRSPALHVRAVLYTAAPAIKEIASTKIAPCDSCIQPVILPNGVITYDATVNADVLSADKMERIKNGTDTIVLFGRIDYSDAETNAHVTTVCMRYISNSQSFGACERGNDLD